MVKSPRTCMRHFSKAAANSPHGRDPTAVPLTTTATLQRSSNSLQPIGEIEVHDTISYGAPRRTSTSRAGETWAIQLFPHVGHSYCHANVLEGVETSTSCVEQSEGISPSPTTSTSNWTGRRATPPSVERRASEERSDVTCAIRFWTPITTTSSSRSKGASSPSASPFALQRGEVRTRTPSSLARLQSTTTFDVEVSRDTSLITPSHSRATTASSSVKPSGDCQTVKPLSSGLPTDSLRRTNDSSAPSDQLSAASMAATRIGSSGST